MSFTRRVAFVLSTGFLSCMAIAQQGAAVAAPPPPANVVLDVVVDQESGQQSGHHSDQRTGTPVAGLQSQDFSILDNKVPQAIAAFHQVHGVNNPVDVTIVIDAINTGYQQIAYERGQIDHFLRANGGHLANPVALGFATQTGVQIQKGYTTDGNALADELKKSTIDLRSIGRSAGFRGAEERFNLSVASLGELVTLNRTRPGRKMILWVSPGWPLLAGTTAELTSRDRRTLFAQVVKLSTQLRESRVTLYSIDPVHSEDVAQTLYYQAFLKGVSKPGDAQIANLALQVLAVQSGGLALNSSNNVGAMLDTAMRDTRNYYELSFNPPAAGPTEEFHRLEVRLDKPGLTARTRENYYAPISADAASSGKLAVYPTSRF